MSFLIIQYIWLKQKHGGKEKFECQTVNNHRLSHREVDKHHISKSHRDACIRKQRVYAMEQNLLHSHSSSSSHFVGLC